MHYIIISRFEEPLDPVLESWTRDSSLSVRIYNKSRHVREGEIALPNVGREAHTFATACLDLYDEIDLGDTVTFLQAGFREHVDLDSLSQTFTTPDISVVPHARYIARCDLDGRPDHPGLRLAPAKRRLESICDIRLPEIFVFAAGAQYTVSASRIHRYSKRQWARLCDILGREYTFGHHDHDGIDPWQMERFWPSVFRGH